MLSQLYLIALKPLEKSTYQTSMITMVVNTAVVCISVECTLITCSTWWLRGWSTGSLCCTLCCWCIGALRGSIWIASGGSCRALCRWNISIMPVVLCSSHQWVFSLSTEFTLKLFSTLKSLILISP